MQPLTLGKDIEEKISNIKQILNNNMTIVYREFENNENVKFCAVYDSTMCSSEIISKDIIKPILSSKSLKKPENNDLCSILAKQILIASKYKLTSDLSDVIDSVLEGDLVLFIDKTTEGLIIEAKGYSKRSISEPSTQKVVKGPKDAFTEDIDTNISLLRRRLPDKNFRINIKKVGTISKTNVAVCYIEGLAPIKILDEVNKRLSNIDIDGILESNYIDELINDYPISIFRTIGNTERPDSVASKLLEGRIAIICNGSPFVLTIPFLFVEYFQKSEDYYTNYLLGSINRLLRIIGFILTISMPAVYIAITNYHQEMIPTNLAISIAIARKGVPFPNYIELLLYLFLFEIIRESAQRIPDSVGQIIGLLGALVIGESAVIAKLVSVPLLIIVSLTGLTSFMIIELKGTILVIRLAFIFFAMVLGLYGYIFALCGLVYYLISLRSFGVPYLLNSNVIDPENIKDTIIRAPWSFMKNIYKISGDFKRRSRSTKHLK